MGTGLAVSVVVISCVVTLPGLVASAAATARASTAPAPTSIASVPRGLSTFSATPSAGALTLGCTSALVVGGTPLAACDGLELPAIQLNGFEQSVGTAMEPLTIITTRDSPRSGWSLSAAMVPTAPSGNANASCALARGFCDSSDGTHAQAVRHGRIPPADLTLRGYSCRPAVTNAASPPTTSAGSTLQNPVPLCWAQPGAAAGTWTVSGGKFTLTVPSDVYAGKYVATVEYTLIAT